MYDTNNIFAKIARGDVPCNKIAENEHALSFHDVNPVAETHVLVIPRGQYANIFEFTKNASAAEQAAFWALFNQTAEMVGATRGCNVMANIGMGTFFYQSVPHFHMHIIAGRRLKDFADIVIKEHDSNCPGHSACASEQG